MLFLLYECCGFSPAHWPNNLLWYAALDKGAAHPYVPTQPGRELIESKRYGLFQITKSVLF